MPLRIVAEVLLGMVAVLGIVIGLVGRCLELTGDAMLDMVDGMDARLNGEGE